MATIHEEFAIVKISKLVKSTDEAPVVLTAEVKEALAELVGQAIAELTGDTGLIVEVQGDD
jgi:hypothetical protein